MTRTSTKKPLFQKIDIYREMVARHGKGKVWRMTHDQLCDEIEDLLWGLSDEDK